jgi:hypothetical protein
MHTDTDRQTQADTDKQNTARVKKNVGPRIHKLSIASAWIKKFAKSKEWFWGRNTVQERQSRMKLAIIAEGFEPSSFNPKPHRPTVTFFDVIREILHLLHVKVATFIYGHLQLLAVRDIDMGPSSRNGGFKLHPKICMGHPQPMIQCEVMINTDAPPAERAGCIACHPACNMGK